MQFTEDLDWTTFDKQNFQSFQFNQEFYTLDMFSFEYTITATNSYQIRICPKLYIFMYNLVITTTIMTMPDPNFIAQNGRPFHQTVYNQTFSLTWSQIKAPVTEFQKQVTSALMNITS